MARRPSFGVRVRSVPDRPSRDRVAVGSTGACHLSLTRPATAPRTCKAAFVPSMSSGPDRLRVGIATPGGDAPGMNACLRSTVKASRVHTSPPIELVGFLDGALGLVRGRKKDIVRVDERLLADKLDRAGTVLRSARADSLREVLGAQNMLLTAADRIAATCLKQHINGLVLIGGDTTCEAARLVNKATDGRVAIVVIPASIDNDVAATSTTIGFDSAVEAAVASVDNIRQTAAALGRIFIVETMGAESGQIAAHVGLASGAEEVLVPEHGDYSEADLKELADRLRDRSEQTRSSLVIAAEGATFSGAVQTPTKRAGSLLERLLRERMPRGTQIRTTILGHLQRGALPTATTRALAAEAGVLAIDTVYDHCRRISRADSARAKARMVSLHPPAVMLRDIPKTVRRRDREEVLRLVELQTGRLSY